MNIRLFLAGQPLDLTQDIIFPLNKTFESLTDPTQIIVDYSKSINIPMNAHNNKVFANAYRLDRNIVLSDSSNIGLFLDPSKKIPFRLDYNGDILLEGYAKYVSASYSNNKKCYTINLFGVLGEVFQELLSVVTSQTKLGDLDRKYLLDDTRYITSGILLPISKETVYDSWVNDNPDCWVPGKTNKVSWNDMYGFAPAHQGIYKEFKADKMQTEDSTIVELSKYLNNHWNNQGSGTSTEIDYGADDIVGDGFPDYVMNEYRASKMKPYIYINQLMRMYVDKCSELTDYKITLDGDWFNENNPYWSRMLYTLDYLNLENQIDSTRFKLFGPSSTQSYTAEVIVTPAESPISVTMQPKSGTSVNFMSDNGFYINPFDIQFGVKQYINDYNGSIHQGYIRLLDETAVKFKIELYNKSGDTLNLQKTFYYWTSGANSPNIYNNESDIYDVKNFIDNRLEDSNLSGYGEATATYSTTIPQLFVPGVYTEGAVMKITMYYYNRPGANGTSALYELFFEDDLGEQYRSIFPGWDNGNTRDDRYPWGWGTIYSQTAAGESEYITISTLYKNDSPLFELILQYTKMFGLCWDVDYGNKEIKILTRKNLFKNYTVTNWDNKLDRKKDLTIEPLTFKEKYILFNYDDVTGYIYSEYKDTYGVNIGEKRLSTGYDFNTSDKQLFSGIKPSSMSSRSYIPFDKMYNWDKASILDPVVEQFTLIDTDDKDQKAPIALNSWFMRGDNYTKNCYITSDTSLMADKKTYCWLDPTYAVNNGAGVQSSVLPNISTAIKFKDGVTYSSNFNTPIEDRTFNKILSNTLNTNIYELCWKDYLNERYNIQNKKVTGYFFITNEDYNNFKFNQFITLDNQLFMINKIYDFDINNPKSTKIDLVQINDPSKLTNKIFGNQATTFKLRR